MKNNVSNWKAFRVFSWFLKWGQKSITKNYLPYHCCHVQSWWLTLQRYQRQDGLLGGSAKCSSWQNSGMGSPLLNPFVHSRNMWFCSLSCNCTSEYLGSRLLWEYWRTGKCTFTLYKCTNWEKKIALCPETLSSVRSRMSYVLTISTSTQKGVREPF